VSNENNAAQADPLDTFVQEAIDQGSVQESAESQTTESAPVEDTKETNSTEAEKPTEDGFQKRINKVTKKAYDQERRADELQKKLDELNKKPELVKPKLEDHDYDEEAFNSANVDYKIQEGVKAQLEANSQQQAQLSQQAEQQKITDSFNEQASALGKEDFNDVITAVPELPAGVADAIMQEVNGAELAYHLGTNLDIADKLASMTPAAAMMELGRISSNMSIKPEIKTSAAPDPIEPVSAGSTLQSNVDDEMSMSDWMAKFG